MMIRGFKGSATGATVNVARSIRTNEFAVVMPGEPVYVLRGCETWDDVPDALRQWNRDGGSR